MVWRLSWAQATRGPALARGALMAPVASAVLFTLDRVRTVLLALSLIVLMKTAWILFTPAAG